MNLFDFIKLALFAITRNKTRAFLTMLGIIIGVGAVIAMIGIGEGSKKASIDIIQNMGSNMLTIFNGGGASNSRMGPLGQGSVVILLEEDAATIERDLKDSSVVAATPQVRAGRAVIYQNNNAVSSIQGSGVQFLQIRGWEVDKGRFFTEQETKGMAKVCVIGTTVRDELFPAGDDPIGKTIRVGALPFEVVGVLESKGAGMMGDQDDIVVAPYTTVMHKIIGIDHSAFARFHFAFRQFDHAIRIVQHVVRPFVSQLFKYLFEYIEMIILFIAYHINHLFRIILVVTHQRRSQILCHVN